MTRQAASKSDVNNIEVSCECTSDRLGKYLSNGALVICDCEGCEFELLTPSVVPTLQESTVVVEMHVSREQNASFVERFSDSIRCSLIEYKTPNQSLGTDPDSYPELDGYSEPQGNLAVSDLRAGDQTWLYAAPYTPHHRS
jgi:hypothetical protein